MTGRLHEDYGREQALEPGGVRGFGLVMAVAIPLITWVFWREFWIIGLAVGAVFAILGLLESRVLAPLNRLWFRLGLLLGKIVSPLVMGVIFFGVVTPIGLIRRLLGKYSMPTRFDPDATSYWQHRDPPGPDPEQLPRQF